MTEQEILTAAKQYIAEEKDASFRKEVEDLVAKKNWKELEDRFYRHLNLVQVDFVVLWEAEQTA